MGRRDELAVLEVMGVWWSGSVALRAAAPSTGLLLAWVLGVGSSSDSGSQGWVSTAKEVLDPIPPSLRTLGIEPAPPLCYGALL